MKKLMMTTAAMVLLGAGAAHADDKDTEIVGGILPGEISVIGDGSGYKSVSADSDIIYRVKLYYNTGTFGRIKSWSVNPSFSVDNEFLNHFWFTVFGEGESFPQGDRPKQIMVLPELRVPLSFDYLKNAILRACNDALQARLDGGMAPVQAFATEEVRELGVHYDDNVSASGSGSWLVIEEYGGQITSSKIPIYCKPIAITPDMPGLVKAPKPAKPGAGSVKAPKPARLPEIGARPQPGTTPGTAPGRAPATKATLVPVRPVPTRPQTAGRP